MSQHAGFYLEIRDSQAGEKVMGEYFHQTSVRIGRSSRCDVVVDRSFVSSQHVDVRQNGGVFEVRDLNSQNGVYVNKNRLTTGSWTPLTKGAEFSIGPLVFVVLREDPTHVSLPGPARKRSAVTVNGEIRQSSARPAEERLAAAYQKLQAVRSMWEQEVLQVVAVAREQHEPDLPMRLLGIYPKSDWSHLETAGDFLIEGKLHTVLVATLRELVPGAAVPADEQEAAKLIEHMGAVIQAMVRAVVAVEHAVASEREKLSLEDSGAPERGEQQLLSDLLNWHRPVANDEFANHMLNSILVFQRMLAASITAGHALFTSISPAEVERSTRRRWPTRSSVLWNSYAKLYRSKAGDGYQGLPPVFFEIFTSEYRRLKAQRDDSEVMP